MPRVRCSLWFTVIAPLNKEVILQRHIAGFVARFNQTLCHLSIYIYIYIKTIIYIYQKRSNSIEFPNLFAKFILNLSLLLSRKFEKVLTCWRHTVSLTDDLARELQREIGVRARDASPNMAMVYHRETISRERKMAIARRLTLARSLLNQHSQSSERFVPKFTLHIQFRWLARAYCMHYDFITPRTGHRCASLSDNAPNHTRRRPSSVCLFSFNSHLLIEKVFELFNSLGTFDSFEFSIFFSAILLLDI